MTRMNVQMATFYETIRTIGDVVSDASAALIEGNAPTMAYNLGMLTQMVEAARRDIESGLAAEPDTEVPDGCPGGIHPDWEGYDWDRAAITADGTVLLVPAWGLSSIPEDLELGSDLRTAEMSLDELAEAIGFLPIPGDSVADWIRALREAVEGSR